MAETINKETLSQEAFEKHGLAPKRRVVTITSQKGGVGKTTLTYELGVMLAHEGFRILFVDIDPQASFSWIFNVDSADMGSLNYMLGGECDIFSGRADCTLDLVPGCDELNELIFYVQEMQKATPGFDYVAAFRDVIKSQDYDFVFIDTQSSMAGGSIQAALGAADFCMIPVTAGPMDADSLYTVIDRIRAAQVGGNPGLTGLGFVRNNITKAEKILNEGADQRFSAIEEYAQENGVEGMSKFQTIVYKTTAIPNALQEGLGATEYRKTRKEAKDNLIAFMTEFLQRIKDREGDS